nr:hypothetical protein [Streptomyces halobius]
MAATPCLTFLVVLDFGVTGSPIRNDVPLTALSLLVVVVVVLADTGRLADSFAAINYFEHRGIPFVVGVDCFGGARSLLRCLAFRGGTWRSGSDRAGRSCGRWGGALAHGACPCCALGAWPGRG